MRTDETETVDQPTLLIVDDTPENLMTLGQLLTPHYRVLVARSGPEALEIAFTSPRLDLILLDVMMEGMDGFAVLRRLLESDSTREIPVIFVTSMDQIQDEEHGLRCGAVDYITKPFSPAIVLARVRTHLELKSARDKLQRQNAELEAEVRRRIQELLNTQEATIQALAHLAGLRDSETGSHLRRTQDYVRTLAMEMRRYPQYVDLLSDEYINKISRSAPLHDIGKVGIPDHILLKPGPLNAEEWEIMREHTTLGRQAIEQVERNTRIPLGFLELAKEIAQNHHERWDGRGYPAGLAGEDIPLSARLMSLADAFDALTTWRVYKKPFSFQRAYDLITGERGARFDPAVVDAFISRFEDFTRIALRYADADED